MDVAVLCSRCGPGCTQLNQCQCIELFQKQKGESNVMDQKFPKSLTWNQKLPFKRSLFWDAPLRMISMSDQTRIPKSFASYYLPKWALSKHHSNCLSTSNRSNEAVKAYSAASVDQLFPEAHRMMLEIKQKNAELSHSHSDVMVRQAWCFSMSYSNEI